MTTKKQLQNKITELQAQVDAMPDDKPTKTTGRAYLAPDLGEIFFHVDHNNEVYDDTWCNFEKDREILVCGNVFLDEESAERQAYYNVLWQQCRKAMRDAWAEHGETCDWGNLNQRKYCLEIHREEVNKETYYTNYHPIAFPTPKSRGNWRKTVTDDDIRLMLMGVE